MGIFNKGKSMHYKSSLILEVITHAACVECGAVKGEGCTSGKGHRLQVPHPVRRKAFIGVLSRIARSAAEESQVKIMAKACK